MRRLAWTICICALPLAGCGASAVFEAEFDSYKNGVLTVDCSDEVNKGKRNIDDVAYLCGIRIAENTKIAAESGTAVSFEEMEPAAPLRIVLTKPRKITKDADDRMTGLVAEEAIWLGR